MGRRVAERTTSRLFLHYWLPAALYAALILSIGSIPNVRPPATFLNADKVAHLIEYMVLGILLTRAGRVTWKTPMTAALVAICVGIAIGTIDEWHQASVPGRSSSGIDLLADTVGLGLAPFALRAFSRG